MSQSNNLSTFGNRLRVRVCGILKRNEKILLLKHNSIGTKGYLWSPPGGGVKFGEDLRSALIREYKEETNLDVVVEEFLFTNEYLQGSLHALEFFFKVKETGGDLSLGSDPELHPEAQMLEELRFFTKEELKSMDSETIHNAFRTVDATGEIEKIRGLITFKD